MDLEVYCPNCQHEITVTVSASGTARPSYPVDQWQSATPFSNQTISGEILAPAAKWASYMQELRNNSYDLYLNTLRMWGSKVSGMYLTENKECAYCKTDDPSYRCYPDWAREGICFCTVITPHDVGEAFNFDSDEFVPDSQSI